MFNLGVGELTVLLLLALILVGPKTLPAIGRGMGETFERWRARQLRGEPPRLLLQRRPSRGWTLTDWLLALAAVALAAVVIANAALRWAR